MNWSSKFSKIEPVRVEYWAWVLIYAGLGLLSLGLFMPRVGVGALLGYVLIAGGAVIAALGVFLIYLRSLMPEPQPEAMPDRNSEQLIDIDQP